MSLPARIVSWLSVSLLLGCVRPQSDEHSAEALGKGVVARVGSDEIQAATVARIAARQGVTPRRARDDAVRDAILASGARLALRESLVRQLKRAILAREVLDALKEESRGQGPPSADEYEREVARRWRELDRPDANRVVHAVVRFKDGPDPMEETARAVAERVFAAVRGALSPQDFAARAGRVPPEGLEVRIEAIPPTAADGRTVILDEPPGTIPGKLDPDFARAANDLTFPGEISQVVRSQFGYHVLMLVERMAGYLAGDEERRAVVEPVIYGARTRVLQKALMDVLRQRTPVLRERSAEQAIHQLMRAR